MGSKESMIFFSVLVVVWVRCFWEQNLWSCRPGRKRQTQKKQKEPGLEFPSFLFSFQDQVAFREGGRWFLDTWCHQTSDLRFSTLAPNKILDPLPRGRTGRTSLPLPGFTTHHHHRVINQRLLLVTYADMSCENNPFVNQFLSGWPLCVYLYIYNQRSRISDPPSIRQSVIFTPLFCVRTRPPDNALWKAFTSGSLVIPIQIIRISG